MSLFLSKGSGADPKMWGWFCCAIGAVAGSGLGGFPPSGGAFEVVAGVAGADNDAVPLVFLVDGSCTGDLLVEGTEEVCVGRKELLDALVLGGGMGAGCFPLDMGGVET